jgi:serine protease AprX
VLSGTSFSTPIVAGCAALLLEQHPQLTPDQVKKMLLNGAKDLHFDPSAQGSGLVQLGSPN